MTPPELDSSNPSAPGKAPPALRAFARSTYRFWTLDPEARKPVGENHDSERKPASPLLGPGSDHPPSLPRFLYLRSSSLKKSVDGGWQLRLRPQPTAVSSDCVAAGPADFDRRASSSVQRMRIAKLWRKAQRGLGSARSPQRSAVSGGRPTHHRTRLTSHVNPDVNVARPTRNVPRTDRNAAQGRAGEACTPRWRNSAHDESADILRATSDTARFTSHEPREPGT